MIYADVVSLFLFLLIVVGVSAIPYADNLRHFNVAITGPDESPYAGIIYHLEAIIIPSSTLTFNV
jgi:hypothetical protein